MTTLKLAMPVLGLGALSVSAQANPRTEKNDKPNVLLVFVDDLGYKDTGFTGSDFYETPVIDSLASVSMVFNNSYSAAGNSVPSRACLISGNYTPRHGIYSVFTTLRGPREHMRLDPVPDRQSLPLECYTIADAMTAAGYNCGIAGKWHLGTDPKYLPINRGFGFDQWEKTQTDKAFVKSNDPKNIFREVDNMTRFIRKSATEGKPFFGFLSFHAVHTKWRARQEYIDYFKAKEKGVLHNEAVYAAMIKHVDDAVGMMVEELRRLGIDKNTVIVFTSDNGGVPQTSQAPLRGFKGTFYEGGVRVPTFIHYPGGLTGHNDTPIINIDFFATFTDMAKAKLPKKKIVDGESLLPILEGRSESLKREAIFWHFPGYLDKVYPGARDDIFRQRPATMIRKGDWKLILYHEEWLLDGGRAKIDQNNCVELFNLRKDISEKYNVANEEKARRDELLDDLLDWIDRTHAPLASLKHQ